MTDLFIFYLFIYLFIYFYVDFLSQKPTIHRKEGIIDLAGTQIFKNVRAHAYQGVKNVSFLKNFACVLNR